MGRKSRPIVVKEKINGEWYKKNYFDNNELAERWCIAKSTNSKREFRIEKNKWFAKYPMAYSDKVLDHYENPRNVGSLDKNDPNVGTGMVGAPACGDVMKLQIKVNDQGIIEDAKFKTYGCGSAIASSSLVTEWLKGKNLDEAQTIKNSDIATELALPPVKIHCSILAEDAIRSAINDYKNKIGSNRTPGGTWNPSVWAANIS